MFDWLRRKPADPPSTDEVWLDSAARDAAILRAVQDGAGVVITFFPATLRALRARFAQAGVLEGPRCALVPADGSRGFGLGGPRVLVAERHPLPAENLALLERLRDAAPGVVPTFYGALDEPLMLRFGGDRIQQVAQQLGLTAEEPIAHTLVSRALANAREKVAKELAGRGTPPIAADSMEEWLLLNLGPPRA